MAAQNGIITAAEAKKLYSYPTLDTNANHILKGNGTWGELTLSYETIAGGIRLKWASGSQAVTIPSSALVTETYTMSTDDKTGNLVYKRSNGTTAFTIPVAVGS